MQYQSESIDKLMTALAKAQGEMSSAAKDCKGYNYKYADLASVWGACRDPLSRNELAVTQIETHTENGEILLTILGHSSGQWISSSMAIRVKPSGKTNELQERGSVLTYLRRYALSAIVGVAPAEDDDGSTGNSFTSQPVKPATQAQPSAQRINATQVLEITGLLNKCEEGFRAYTLKFLADNNIAGMENIPLSMYENIKGKINTYFLQRERTEQERLAKEASRGET